MKTKYLDITTTSYIITLLFNQQYFIFYFFKFFKPKYLFLINHLAFTVEASLLCSGFKDSSWAFIAVASLVTEST